MERADITCFISENSGWRGTEKLPGLGPGCFAPEWPEAQPVSLGSTGYRYFGAICLSPVLKNLTVPPPPPPPPGQGELSRLVVQTGLKPGGCSPWPGIIWEEESCDQEQGSVSHGLSHCTQWRPRVWGSSLGSHCGDLGDLGRWGSVPSPHSNQAALLPSVPCVGVRGRFCLGTVSP